MDGGCACCGGSGGFGDCAVGVREEKGGGGEVSQGCKMCMRKGCGNIVMSYE